MTKKWLKRIILIGILGFVVAFLGLLRWWPAEWRSDNRMHALNNSQFSQRADAARTAAKSNFEEGARLYNQAEIQRDHNRQLVDNYRRNCPENSQWDDPAIMRVKTMDLTGCDVGTAIWLQLHDAYSVETYAVRLYKYGEGPLTTPLETRIGKRLLFISEEPELKPQRPGPHHVAQRTAANEYRIGGEVVFYHRGNADFLELVRK